MCFVAVLPVEEDLQQWRIENEKRLIVCLSARAFCRILIVRRAAPKYTLSIWLATMEGAGEGEGESAQFKLRTKEPFINVSDQFEDVSDVGRLVWGGARRVKSIGCLVCARSVLLRRASGRAPGCF